MKNYCIVFSIGFSIGLLFSFIFINPSKNNESLPLAMNHSQARDFQKESTANAKDNCCNSVKDDPYKKSKENINRDNQSLKSQKNTKDSQYLALNIHSISKASEVIMAIKNNYKTDLSYEEYVLLGKHIQANKEQVTKEIAEIFDNNPSDNQRQMAYEILVNNAIDLPNKILEAALLDSINSTNPELTNHSHNLLQEAIIDDTYLQQSTAEYAQNLAYDYDPKNRALAVGLLIDNSDIDTGIEVLSNALQEHSSPEEKIIAIDKLSLFGPIDGDEKIYHRVRKIADDKNADIELRTRALTALKNREK